MAKLFLEKTDDRYKISGGNTSIFGANDSQTVVLDASIRNITLDANVEKIEFANPMTDYQFKQAGNTLNVYDTSNVIVAKIGIQGDADGTQLAFFNATVDAKFILNAGSAPTLSVGNFIIPVVITAPDTFFLTFVNCIP